MKYLILLYSDKKVKSQCLRREITNVASSYEKDKKKYIMKLHGKKFGKSNIKFVSIRRKCITPVCIY